MLSFREIGQAPAPTVVFLHGCPTSVDHLEPLARGIADTHRCIMMELPGYGRSSYPPPGDGNVVGRGEIAIVATLRSIGVRRLSLVGHSLGGYRALSLACSGLFDVDAVIALGGFARLPEEIGAGLAAVAPAVRSGSLDLETGASERFLAPENRTRANVAEVNRWAHATTRSVLADELEAAAQLPDLRPALAGTHARVVARVGAMDTASPPHLSEEIAAALQGGSCEIVANAGHALVLEDFVGTLESIKRALRMSA